MKERKNWTEAEDLALKRLREEENISKWSDIARIMEMQFGIKQRNQKQCRQRYQNHLCPEISTQKLTEDEEAQLFRLHEQHGNRWSFIASRMKGRTDNILKNHFHSKLRGAIRKVNRTLALKKKKSKNAKSFPLSIVYKIVKYFGQKGDESMDIQPQGSITKLKNALLTFNGSNIEGAATFQNQEAHFLEILRLLEWFEKSTKPQSKKRNSSTTEKKFEEVSSFRRLDMEKKGSSFNESLSFPLFKTFSDNDPLKQDVQKKASEFSFEPLQLVENKLSIEKSVKSRETAASAEKIDTENRERKLSYNLSCKAAEQQIDISGLVKEDPTLGAPKMCSVVSIISMDKNFPDLLNRESQMSRRSSGVWVKGLNDHRIESSIFQ